LDYKSLFVEKIILSIYVLFAILFQVSCKQEPSRTEFALGTLCHITLFEQGQDKVYDDVFARIREIENLMSVNIPSSDVSRVNAAAGIEPVKVHEETFAVIKLALYYAKLSGGAFDPSVGPIVSLWGIGGGRPRVPSQAEINEILPIVNWQYVELDEETLSVFLTRRDMALDLGGIAKGYAADEAAAVIKKAGIERAIINLGGNIVTCGERKDGKPWRVGVQNPNDDRDKYIGVLQVTEKSVVTSGVYERFFEKEGRRYHHIFSPNSGYSADNGLLSVTIIAPRSIDADALSTAVFVLGYERGSALIESLAETEAVFIFSDLGVRKTSGANFSLTDETFRLE
jgi:thiamine biosynthesis lipoprotein